MLNHKDYSGFFPFYTVPYSRVSPWGYAMPLPFLTKCHWLAKSATLSVGLSYSLTTYGYDENSPPQPPDTESDITGTITGSGVVSSALMALPPGQRAAYAGAASTPSGLLLLNTPPAFLIDSGKAVFTDTSNPSSDNTSPYSQPPAAFSLAWFNGMPLSDTLRPQGPVAWDQDADKWSTDLDCSISGGIGPAVFSASTVSGGSSSMSFVLSILGAPFASIPLVGPVATFPPAPPTVAVSGSITLDFDSFWTP